MHSTRTRTRTYTHAHLPSSAWLTVNNWSTSTTNSARITFSQRPKTVTFNGDLSDFLNSNQGDDDHPLAQISQNPKNHCHLPVFLCTSELEMMQDIHRWSADTSMASPEDMIDQDGSVTLEALSKLQVLLPSFFFKTILELENR